MQKLKSGDTLILHWLLELEMTKKGYPRLAAAWHEYLDTQLPPEIPLELMNSIVVWRN